MTHFEIPHQRSLRFETDQNQSQQPPTQTTILVDQSATCLLPLLSRPSHQACLHVRPFPSTGESADEWILIVEFEKNNEGKLVLSETWKKWVRETVPNNFEEIIKNGESSLRDCLTSRC